jgi:hypothetical protein
MQPGPVFRDLFPGMQLIEDSLDKSPLHRCLGYERRWGEAG